MKHQFFFFVLLCPFSMYAMQPEKNSITKSQIADSFAAFNCHMKRYYPYVFDTKKFGSFVLSIREMNKDEFESNKEDLIKKLESVQKGFDPNTNIFDIQRLTQSEL